VDAVTAHVANAISGSGENTAFHARAVPGASDDDLRGKRIVEISRPC